MAQRKMFSLLRTGMSSCLQPDWGWHLPWWRRSWCWYPWWTCLDPAASLSKTCHKQYPAMPGAACESASELLWCETTTIRKAKVAIDMVKIHRHLIIHSALAMPGGEGFCSSTITTNEMSQCLALPIICSCCRKMTTTQPKPFCLYKQFLTEPVAFSTRRRNLACAFPFFEKTCTLWLLTCASSFFSQTKQHFPTNAFKRMSSAVKSSSKWPSIRSKLSFSVGKSRKIWLPFVGVSQIHRQNDKFMEPSLDQPVKKNNYQFMAIQYWVNPCQSLCHKLHTLDQRSTNINESTWQHLSTTSHRLSSCLLVWMFRPLESEVHFLANQQEWTNAKHRRKRRQAPQQRRNLATPSCTVKNTSVFLVFKCAYVAS